MKSNFKPLIKNNSSLQEKKVTVQGSTSFSRENIDPIIKPSTKKEVLPKREVVENSSSKLMPSNIDTDRRLRASTTQKTSPSTNLKINTLKPFLKEVEGMNKATFNDIISLLADNYAQTKFTTRQLEAYKSMYKTQFDMLDK
ncbi:hypothetical protein [Enterococcus sp. 5H]|uniref:hypothetical protein n=1 Tax=Enterococcus sp. 5H TaxID=1229490 RepID=UPI002303F0E9|nr:hypothetical protein [Enterococcus sp. 5H]